MSRLAILTTIVIATAASAQDADKEMEKLNGTWVVVSAESGGTKIPPAEVKEIQLSFKDGTFSAKGGNDESKGTLKIDPTKKPMTLDIVFETGPMKGKTQLAIYELQMGMLKISR